MDHQASASTVKIKSNQNIFIGIFIGLALFHPNVTFGQAVNPLTVNISITATAPSPLILPQSDPGGTSSGPVNLVDTNDVAIFRGIAYPRSTVSLLKNGSVIAQSLSKIDGTFEIHLQNLPGGTYTFGIRALDEEKRISKLLTVTIFITSGVTTLVDGIFIPPTITSDKEEVKQGSTILFSGRAAPLAEVRLSFMSSSEVLKKTTSNDAGIWSYALSTEGFLFGAYTAKARTVSIVDISPYGDTLSFTISNVDKLRKKTSLLSGIRKRCDLNDDNRVNLLDFSIMAFWYKRFGFPDKVDLNTDSKVNLTDLSILAYCWTG